jgi:hypothetical protein
MYLGKKRNVVFNWSGIHVGKRFSRDCGTSRPTQYQS